MILPVVKLGALALKTACKPLANTLKKEARRHPKFRSLIVSMAQANHRISTNLQRRVYGHSTDVAIQPLNEERAVQAAADLFGELFVFAVAGSIVVFEVQRNTRSEARKEELRKQEVEALKRNEQEIAKKIEMLEQKLADTEKLTLEKGLLGTLSYKHSGSHGQQPVVSRSTT